MTPTQAKMIYYQPADSCHSGDQYLTVETRDAGGGIYLTIQTDCWALDVEQLESFIAELRRVAGLVKSVFEEPT